MSLETLLQAAEFVESSSGPNKKENTSNPRGNLSSNVLVDRRRVVSESDASERRRRPGGAGTRETHNKLEKNRRAHLKECFDILKKQVPTLEEKKTSNLNILRSALKYIQTMKKQEQDYETQVDVLKVNNKSLLERLGALKGKAKSEVNEQSASSTSAEIKQSSLSKKPTSLPSESLDSRILPISVATQTSPNLDKEGAPNSSAAELEESGRNTCVSTSSTDTGVEGDESDRKISICEEDDEKTDTDEDLNDEDNEQDIEIDVVGPDDSSSSDSLQLNVESNEGQCEVNGAIDEEKKNLSGETRCRNTAKFNRKRSKSEVKCEEDSDYDENTKEEPKSKIQACARVSV